jgi:hypothetical protein
MHAKSSYGRSLEHSSVAALQAGIQPAAGGVRRADRERFSFK